MIATFQNSAFVLSTGIFFTLMAAGLPGKLPAAMPSGLTAQGVPAATAAPISHLPRPACCPPPSPAATRCGNCPARCCITCPGPRGLRGRAGVFPHLITAPSHSGPGVAFGSAITASVIAAAASALTGQGHADPRRAPVTGLTNWPPRPAKPASSPANSPSPASRNRTPNRLTSPTRAGASWFSPIRSVLVQFTAARTSWVDHSSPRMLRAPGQTVALRYS